MHEAPQRSQGLACLDACLHRVAYPACTGSGGLKKQRDEEFFHARCGRERHTGSVYRVPVNMV